MFANRAGEEIGRGKTLLTGATAGGASLTGYLSREYSKVKELIFPSFTTVIPFWKETIPVDRDRFGREPTN